MSVMSGLIKLVIILIYISKPCVLEEALSHRGKEAGSQPTSSHLWDIFRFVALSKSFPLLQCSNPGPSATCEHYFEIKN